jgi:hypothetical protein
VPVRALALAVVRAQVPEVLAVAARVPVVRVRALADLVAATRVPVVVQARALVVLVAAMLVPVVAPVRVLVAWAMVLADRATATAMVKEAAREEREVASTNDLDAARR